MSNKVYPKPHATFKEHGVTYVKHMVAPEIRQLLDLMDSNPGSFLLVTYGVTIRSTPTAVLALPGQDSKLKVASKVEDICAWLVKDEVQVNGQARYSLPDEAMDYIRGMERRQP